MIRGSTGMDYQASLERSDMLRGSGEKSDEGQAGCLVGGPELLPQPHELVVEPIEVFCDLPGRNEGPETEVQHDASDSLRGYLVYHQVPLSFDGKVSVFPEDDYRWSVARFF